MSSVAEPFQRDELHLFLAVLLHITVGLVIYIFLITGERKPHSVMLEGLPIVFGKMVSPGTNDGDAPKTLAKSDPVQAEQTAPVTVAQAANAPVQAQQKPAVAAVAKPVVPRSGTVATATQPVTRQVRPAEPVVTKSEARPPASVAQDSPVGKSAVAANVPALRLQPDPDEAERNPLPAEAAAARTAETVSPVPPKSVPPTAEKASEEAKAKLANLPGIKPALVPQLDARPRVVVPPKPVERELEKAPEPETKLAEAKRAPEAATAAADTSEAKTPLPPAVNETPKAAAVTAEPPKVTAEQPVVVAEKPAAAKTAEAGLAPQKAAESAQKPATPNVPPATAVATPQAPQTEAAVPDASATVPQLDARPRVVVPPKPVERELEKAPEPETKLAEAKRAPEAATAAADTSEAKTPLPPAVNETPKAAAVTAEPPKVTAEQPVVVAEKPAAAKTAEAGLAPQKAAESAQKPATPNVPPATAVATPQAPQTEAAVPDASATPQAQASVAAPPEISARQEAQSTQTAEAVPDTSGETAGAAPVPRVRLQGPEPQQSAAVSEQQQPGGSGGGNTGSSGAGASAGGGQSKQQRDMDALRKAAAGLGGLGKGKRGVPGGTSLTSSQLSQGSRLAQTCLDQKKVFKFGDQIATTFTVKVDRGLKRLTLSPGGGNGLSRPRVAEINRALNSCDPFKDFVLAQPGLTTFSFNFASGVQ